jgi:hypothetical protein
MKTLTAIAAAVVLTLSFTASVQADGLDTDSWTPVKLQLTVHQQRLLDTRAEAGASVTVLPLTPGQEAFLSNRWDGWKQGMVTVHSEDRFDASDTVWVAPNP